MTVGELIGRLQEYPDHHEVLVKVKEGKEELIKMEDLIAVYPDNYAEQGGYVAIEVGLST